MIFWDICNNYNLASNLLLYKSVIFIGDNITTTANVNCGLMHTFTLERNAKFQLGISINDNVIFSHPSSQIS